MPKVTRILHNEYTRFQLLRQTHVFEVSATQSVVNECKGSVPYDLRSMCHAVPLFSVGTFITKYSTVTVLFC